MLATGNYDWVVYKQADTVFVKPASMGFWINDVAVMFRNSPEGMTALDELVALQNEMSFCGAPGMGVINAWMLRRLDGELSPVTGKYEYYGGDCDRSCDKQDSNSASGWFGYRSMFSCFEKLFKRFGRGLWHVRTEDFPGIWVMPASDAFMLRDGRHPLADDLGGFCNFPNTSYDGLSPQGMQGFEIPPVRLSHARIVADSCFCKRLLTTLALHIGGGGRSTRVIELVDDLARLFPAVRYESSSWNVSARTLRGEWTLEVRRFRLLEDSGESPFASMPTEAFANATGPACACMKKLIENTTAHLKGVEEAMYVGCMG
jgi:hypothetical protein